MDPEFIARASKTSAIRRLLRLAEYGYWAPPYDSTLDTEEELALIAAKLVERHPSQWSGMMRVTETGARLADKIVSLVRGELENPPK